MHQQLTDRLVAAVLVAALTGAASCSASRVKAEGPPPALTVPTPPPRVLDPLPQPVVVEAPEPEPEATPESTRKPARSPRPARPAEPTKTEPAPPPESQPTVLRTPSTADPAEAERRVADTLNRARRLLERVRVGSLDAESRLQFESARRFVTQAEGALRAKNYLFATYLADKAEALAADLAAR